MRSLQKIDWSWLYVYIVIFFLLAPLISILLLSLSRTVYLQFPPALFSLQWYRELANNQALLNSFYLSLRVAIPATIISTVCGTLVAIGTRVLGGPILKLNHLLFLGPLIVPYVILATGLSRFFLMIGVRGLPAITLSHATIAMPYVFLLVYAGLNLLPESIEEGAQVLGANRFKVLRKITLPLLKPHIFAGMMFAFIASFGEFIIAYMLSGPRTTLLTVYIYSSVREKTEPSLSALLSLITIVIIFLAFFYSKIYLGKQKL